MRMLIQFLVLLFISIPALADSSVEIPDFGKPNEMDKLAEFLAIRPAFGGSVSREYQAAVIARLGLEALERVEVGMEGHFSLRHGIGGGPYAKVLFGEDKNFYGIIEHSESHLRQFADQEIVGNNKLATSNSIGVGYQGRLYFIEARVGNYKKHFVDEATPVETGRLVTISTGYIVR